MEEFDDLTSPVEPGGVKSRRETELQALLARVEAATGPDRELDALICVALRIGPEPGWLDHLNPDARVEWEADGAKVRIWVTAPGFDRGPLWGRDAPALTASLDAALALVERVLPSWEYTLSGGPETGDTGAWARATITTLMWPKVEAYYSLEAQAPALALIAALLKALSHQPPRAPQEPGDKARTSGGG